MLEYLLRNYNVAQRNTKKPTEWSRNPPEVDELGRGSPYL
jgi:hypothetical protein